MGIGYMDGWDEEFGAGARFGGQNMDIAGRGIGEGCSRKYAQHCGIHWHDARKRVILLDLILHVCMLRW